MVPLHNRIKKLRKESGKSQDEIAEVLGISQVSYSNIETGNSTLTLNQAVKLSHLYKTNVDWLATGNGKKDKTDGNNGFIPLVELQNRTAYLKDGEASLGYDSAHFRLPGFTNGTFRIFENIDNKMHPTLSKHDYLICTEAPMFDEILDGNLYVIVTKDNIYIGNAFKEKNKIILKYNNPAFVEDTFSTAEITEMWLTIAKITSAFFTNDLLQEIKIKKLEQKLEKLEHLVKKIKKMRG